MIFLDVDKTCKKIQILSRFGKLCLAAFSRRTTCIIRGKSSRQVARSPLATDSLATRRKIEKSQRGILRKFRRNWEHFCNYALKKKERKDSRCYWSLQVCEFPNRQCPILHLNSLGFFFEFLEYRLRMIIIFYLCMQMNCYNGNGNGTWSEKLISWTSICLVDICRYLQFNGSMIVNQSQR